MSHDLTVVTYHYVRDIKASRYPGIKGREIKDFIKQIAFLKAEFNIICMERVLEYYSSKRSLPEKALLLTFDDGYSEHFSNVFPILKGFGVQGSFFVPAKTIQERKVLDVNKIHYVLASCSQPGLIVNDIKESVLDAKAEFDLMPFKHYLEKYSQENRFDTGEVIFIKRMLQHALPEELRSRIVEKLFTKFVGTSEEALSSELYMHDYQLREMAAGGMHIGCHGYDHYWWDKLSPDALDREIDLSLDFLSSLNIDLNAWTACYPYGSCNDQVIKVLTSKGCRLALTTVVAPADLVSDHRLRVPRLDTNDFPP